MRTTDPWTFRRCSFCLVTGLLVLSALSALGSKSNAADLPDAELRERLGPSVYDRLSETVGGRLSDVQTRTLETFLRHRDAFEAYRPEDPSTYAAARAGMAELFGRDSASRVEEVHWLLRVGVIEPALSERMAMIRNDMVFEACGALASEFRQMHRVDFSPPKNLLGDIDQTFRSPEFLRSIGLTDRVMVERFEQIYRERFGVSPRHMDVMSHPFEARIPDWRTATKGGLRPEVHEFVARLRKGSALLRSNPEAYFLEGAFRMQVERRSYDADAELYSIFSAGPDRIDPSDPRSVETTRPRAGDPSVARIAVVRTKIREYIYRLVPAPEMRRSYAWGSSVGNWHFFAQHGYDTRSAAKYGLRSFAEGPGWLVLYDEAARPDEARPQSYEELVDLAASKEAVRKVVAAHHPHLDTQEVFETLETAKTIRNAKGPFTLEGAFRKQAVALAGGEDRYERSRQKWLELADRRFRRRMATLMIENIKVSLPTRLADWLDPHVDPLRLGFSPEEVRRGGAKVRQAVDAARKRLRVAALFEVLSGLSVLPPARRAEVLASANAALAKKYGLEAHPFQRVLAAVGRLAEAGADRHLLQTDAEAGRPKRTLVGNPSEDRLRVRVDDPLETARLRQDEIRKRLSQSLEEVRSAVEHDLRPAASADASAVPDPTMRRALQHAGTLLERQWDSSARRAKSALERGLDAGSFKEMHRVAVADMKKQFFDALGYEFRRNWTAVEGLDFKRDVTGYSRRKLVTNILSWNNADAFLSIALAYQQSNGDPEVVSEQIQREAISMLPYVGEAMTFHSVMKGETHFTAVGPVALGFYFPQVGTIMLAWSIADNGYRLYSELQLSSEVRLHLQGMIPNADHTPGPGHGTLGGATLRGFLSPVFDAVKTYRRQLRAEMERDPSLEAYNRYLLDDVYPLTLDGARNYVYPYYNPLLEAKFLANPEAYPREKWPILKLGSHDPAIYSRDASTLYDPAGMPPLLRAYFGAFVTHYFKGTGPFAELPAHQAAHAHPVPRQAFLPGEGDRARREDRKAKLAAFLTVAYLDRLFPKAFPEDRSLDLPFSWDDAETLEVEAYISGMEGAAMTRRTAPGDGPIPDLPSILDVVDPQADLEARKAGFFAYVEKDLDLKLLQRHERFGDRPKSSWTERKIAGFDPARFRAPDHAKVAHPLLLAFFNKQVALYAERVREEQEAQWTPPRNQFGQRIAGTEAPNSRISPEVREELVQQLIAEFRAGMLRQSTLEQRRIDQERLALALPNAFAWGELNAGIFGNDAAGEERTPPAGIDTAREEAATALALHAGDPILDETLEQEVRDRLETFDRDHAESIVEITGLPEEGIQPDKPFRAACTIRATPDYVRPFRVAWSLSRSGTTAAPERLSPDGEGNLMLSSLQLGSAEAPLERGTCTVTAEVTDATGRPVKTVRQRVTIARQDAPEPDPPASATLAVSQIGEHVARQAMTVPCWLKLTIPGGMRLSRATHVPYTRKPNDYRYAFVLRTDAPGSTFFNVIRVVTRNGSVGEVDTQANFRVVQRGPQTVRFAIYTGDGPEPLATAEVRVNILSWAPMKDKWRDQAEETLAKLQAVDEKNLATWQRYRNQANADRLAEIYVLRHSLNDSSAYYKLLPFEVVARPQAYRQKLQALRELLPAGSADLPLEGEFMLANLRHDYERLDALLREREAVLQRHDKLEKLHDSDYLNLARSYRRYRLDPVRAEALVRRYESLSGERMRIGLDAEALDRVKRIRARFPAEIFR